jgi:hypothetical protein
MSSALRAQFISVALIVFIGIWLTGFDKVHWFVYVPVIVFTFAGITGEKRKFIRHDFAIKVAIKFISGPSEGEIHEGFLANKSSSGLCLFTFNPLDIGEEIMLKNNIYIPFQKAIVKWIQEVNKEWYAVGLICKS